MGDLCRFRHRAAPDDGFSLAEAMLVLAIMAVALGLLVGVFQPVAATVQGDSGMYVVEWQLKLARETAINQRRAVEIQFTPPNFLTIVRRNLDLAGSTTVISSVYLEHNIQFMKFPGIPDTPDNFGDAAPIDFGAATAMMFTADGMFVDQSGTAINGTIFLGQTGHAISARALTVFGPTARIRSYKWNGSAWRR
jgi:type II secretory pathway pseudopilin PulG